MLHRKHFKRWNAAEQAGLESMRAKLVSLGAFDLIPPYQDLVGDRPLLRFLRGKNGNVDEATAMYHQFLKWYAAEDIISIRNNILYNGMNGPLKFPKGPEFIEIAPQIVMAPHSRDNCGRPIVFESFGFDPYKFFQQLSLEDYILFLKYCLEYRSLVLEQLSAEMEKEHLEAQDCGDGFGIVLTLCIIRDLNGIGFAHMSSNAKAIINAGLEIAVPNYPDTLGKSHMVNVPCIFHGLWLFIRNLLDANILSKISVCSSSFLDVLKQEMPVGSIPSAIGGLLSARNESFLFDLSDGSGFFSLVDPLQPNTPSLPVDSGVVFTQELEETSATCSETVTPSRETNSPEIVHSDTLENGEVPNEVGIDQDPCNISLNTMHIDAGSEQQAATSEADSADSTVTSSTNKVRLRRRTLQTASGDLEFSLCAAKSDIEDEIVRNGGTPAPTDHVSGMSRSAKKLKLRVKKQLIFYESARYSPETLEQEATQIKPTQSSFSVKPADISENWNNKVVTDETDESICASFDVENPVVVLGINIVTFVPRAALYVAIALVLIDTIVVKTECGLLLLIIRTAAIVFLVSLLVLQVVAHGSQTCRLTSTTLRS